MHLWEILPEKSGEMLTWKAARPLPWRRWLGAWGKVNPANWLWVLRWRRWPRCISLPWSHEQRTSPSEERLHQSDYTAPSGWGLHSPTTHTHTHISYCFVFKIMKYFYFISWLMTGLTSFSIALLNIYARFMNVLWRLSVANPQTKCSVWFTYLWTAHGVELFLL